MLLEAMKRNTTAAADDYFAEAVPDKPTPIQESPSDDNDWFDDGNYEGQLAVDVYQTATTIVIKSAIAGVEPEDLDIAVNRDVVTIRGKRKQQETAPGEDYLFQECYWGGFSRSIILPVEVLADKVDAQLKNGILTVTLPKAKENGARVIRVKGEDA